MSWQEDLDRKQNCRRKYASLWVIKNHICITPASRASIEVRTCIRMILFCYRTSYYRSTVAARTLSNYELYLEQKVSIMVQNRCQSLRRWNNINVLTQLGSFLVGHDWTCLLEHFIWCELLTLLWKNFSLIIFLKLLKACSAWYHLVSNNFGQYT